MPPCLNEQYAAHWKEEFIALLKKGYSVRWKDELFKAELRLIAHQRDLIRNPEPKASPKIGLKPKTKKKHKK